MGGGGAKGRAEQVFAAVAALLEGHIEEEEEDGWMDGGH